MTDTTISMPLDDMTLDQLVQVSQGLGRQVDKLRADRAYVKQKIDARLAAGERNQAAEAGDATAEGAVLVVNAAQ